MNYQEALAVEKTKRAELQAFYEKHDTGAKQTLSDGRQVPIYDFPEGMREEIGRRTEELNKITDENEKLYHAEQQEKNQAQMQGLDNISRRVIGNPSIQTRGYVEPSRGNKSLGQMFTEHALFKLREQFGGKIKVDFDDVDLKTLLTTGGAPGYAPDSPRSMTVVPYAERTPVVADLIPITPTTIAVHKWMEEQAPTFNASQIGEGAAKPESTLDWDEVTQTLTKIAHWVQVTKEQLDDVPGLASLIDNRLIRGIELQEETQLLYGNGSGNNMQGFMTKSGLQTQAFSTNNMDTILKAITLVNYTGFARVSGIVMNPANWETVRLTKGATNQDYVAGSPLLDVSPRLWGYPIVITTAIASGTALVGDFARYSEIRRKTGVEVSISDSHSTNFVYNILVVLAEIRELLAIYRGSAFCRCTSLT